MAQTPDVPRRFEERFTCGDLARGNQSRLRRASGSGGVLVQGGEEVPWAKSSGAIQRAEDGDYDYERRQVPLDVEAVQDGHDEHGL